MYLMQNYNKGNKQDKIQKSQQTMKKSKLQGSSTVQSSKVQKKQLSTTVSQVKKKPVSSQNIRKPSSHISNSKQPQDYIIINDNIYSANTFTERSNYEQFLTSVKKQKQLERKSFLVKSQVTQKDHSEKDSKSRLKKGKRKTFEVEQVVAMMTVQQKRQMLTKLSKQIRQARQHETQCKSPFGLMPQSQSIRQHKLDSSRQRQEKLQIIDQKLQQLRLELMWKSQSQIEKLEQLCANNKINVKEKESKVGLVEGLREHKLRVVECTKRLFQRILGEQGNGSGGGNGNAGNIEAILQSLHSFPSIDSMNTLEPQPCIDHLKLNPNENKVNVVPQNKGNLALQNKFIIDLQKPQNIQPTGNNQQTKIIPSIDNSPLEIIQQDNRAVFLNQWRQQLKIDEQQLKMDLYLTTNPQTNLRHAQIQQPSIMNTFNARQQLRKELIRFHPSRVAKQSDYQDQQHERQLYQQEYEQLQHEQNQEHGYVQHEQHQQSQDEHLSENKNQQLHGLLGNDNKLSLKLDLRLDQVVFGQDEYPQCEKVQQKLQTYMQQEWKPSQNQQSEVQVLHKIQSEEPQSKQSSFHAQDFQHLASQASSIQNILNIPNIADNIQQNTQIPLILTPVSPTQSPTNTQKFSLSSLTPPQHPSEPHQHHQPQHHQNMHHGQKMNINIPMLLSRQKMQTLAYEQNRLFRQNLQKRIAFQMGCVQLQTQTKHFTTLVDINSYIVGFYEFMMRKYINSLVDNLNIPYGKSAIDKLYSLQSQGYILEESYNQMNNILSQAHFLQYQREMMLTVRKCSEYQAAHNKAIFQAFTKCINVYRPYYELQGQVYPWIVSQKGITFYEITDENIEEVFEKSKIKVLECCTSLCGLLPPSEIKNEEQNQMINAKNEENLTKMIKNEILQHFDQWKIRFVNFECLVRMLVAEKLITDIMNQAVSDIGCLNNRTQLIDNSSN